MQGGLADADRRVAVDGVEPHGVRYLLRCAHPYVPGAGGRGVLRRQLWRARSFTSTAHTVADVNERARELTAENAAAASTGNVGVRTGGGT